MSGQGEFKINTKFAEKYDKYRQKEELQKLKDRFGDEEEHGSDTSDSSSDEDSEVELDPKLERDFYRTLSLLKKKDPKIYQQDATFFAGEGTGSNSDDEEPSTSKAVVKPMYLRDYERKVILEKGGKYEDEDDSENEDASRLMQERAASPSYMQEQRDIKASFRKFMQDSDEGSDGDEGMLLKRRVKTQEEKDNEEADYVEWLKGQADLEGKEEVQDMSYLKEYWNDPQLNEKERFLRDYVLNKAYLDEDDDDRIPTYEELVQDDVEDSEEEGDLFLKKQEDFERKYNFRFEEPDSIKVKTYPRNIATSVRTKDDRRKRKREEIHDRKTKEKEQKREQLKQLKNLKRGEIMEKLKQLQDVTGNEELAFSQHDLEGDFDPQQHAQLMEKFFGDEYYGMDEDEKPQFDDEDLEDGHWNWDTWTGEGGEGDGEEEEEYGDEKPENYEPTCEDPDFIMDADYDPSQQPAKKKKKKEREEKKKKQQQKLSKDDLLMGKKRKVSHFADVISKNKPVFDPKDKNFEQYLDEYYRLDYEDIIDDQPCRFRYREVVPNDFGLSTDEILTADEKELNRWCSLKKTCMYRPEKDELCDVKNYQVKAQDVRKKKQIFVSLYSEEEKEEAKGKVGKKRRDRMKNAEQRQKVEEEEEEEEAGCSHTVADTTEGSILKALTEMRAEEEEDEEEFLVPKKKKPKQQERKEVAVAEAAGEETTKPKVDKQNWPRKKPRHPGGRLLSRSFKVKLGGREFSRQRLRAYGLNPKKVHYRELYRQKRIQQEKHNKQKTQKSD